MLTDRVIRVMRVMFISPHRKVSEKVINTIYREATGTSLGITRITRCYTGASVVIQTSAIWLQSLSNERVADVGRDTAKHCLERVPPKTFIDTGIARPEKILADGLKSWLTMVNLVNKFNEKGSHG